jgi:hypothetical protein
MNLVTVASDKYLNHLIQLFDSYNQQPFKQDIYLYCFNFLDNQKDLLFKKYANIKIFDIPQINDYTYNPKIFFFKCFALKNAIQQQMDFIYSDAANVFIRDSSFIIDHINKTGNLFLQYPMKTKMNKFFTTSICFKKMKCDTDEYKNSQQYWAGLQAYKNNEINKKLIYEMYDHMTDKDIAFPEANIQKPEGINSECIYHRNEQSVLSLLIKKYNIEQNFEYQMFNKCGDYPTVFMHDKSYSQFFDYNKILIYPRYSNIYGFDRIKN